MAISDTARRNHDELFPGYVSSLEVTDPELTEVFDNFALDEVLRLKPSAAKGKYVRKVTFSTTMGPGIPVDSNRTRNLLEDAGAAG